MFLNFTQARLHLLTLKVSTMVDYASFVSIASIASTVSTVKTAIVAITTVKTVKTVIIATIVITAITATEEVMVEDMVEVGMVVEDMEDGELAVAIRQQSCPL